MLMDTIYVKHSLRQVHKPCAACGTEKLYYAHEQHGKPDATSATWCSRCKASGTLILVDMDTMQPHSCTPSVPPEASHGDTPPAEEESSDIATALEDIAEGNDRDSAQAQAPVADALDAIQLSPAVGSEEEGEGEAPPPFPQDDEFVTHNELNEFGPLARAEAKEAFDNVRDGMEQIADMGIRHGGRIASLSEQMIELERRTRVVITINDATNNEEYELPNELHHCQLADVIRVLSVEHCLMVGGAGAGKGEIAYQTALALKIPFYTLDQGSLSPQTPVSSIIGYMNSSGKYIGTTFRKAFEHGGLIFLDELDNAHPACLATINAALAIREGQELGFPGGTMVKRHKDFRVLAAANTFGRGPDRTYAARQRGDAATWDRFSILYLQYDHTLEDVLCARTGVDQETVVRVLRYVRKLRENVEKNQGTIPVVIGMRASVGMCKLLKAGLDTDTAIQARCRRGMSDQDWAKVSAGADFFPSPKPSSPPDVSTVTPVTPSHNTQYAITGGLNKDTWGAIKDGDFQLRDSEGKVLDVHVPGPIIISLKEGGHKIQAIKNLRVACPWAGLLEAKIVINHIISVLQTSESILSPPPSYPLSPSNPNLDLHVKPETVKPWLYDHTFYDRPITDISFPTPLVIPPKPKPKPYNLPTPPAPKPKPVKPKPESNSKP